MIKENKKVKEGLSLIIDAIVTLLAVFIVFRIWERDIYVPISYQNDGLGAVATIKGVIEGNWIWDRPYWSAPYGETTYLVDYILPAIIVKVITLFSKNAALVDNIFWLLTYLLTMITTYGLLRNLKVRYSLAIFGSVIYNFLPYHYFRIEHFWLCGCYVIPLALWIILEGMDFIEYKKNSISIGKYFIPKNVVINILFAIIIGLNGIYYSIFSIILILISSFIVSMNKKKYIYFVRSLLYSGFIMLPICTYYFLPSIFLDGGKTLTAVEATRNVGEIELYGLKISSLFFPVQGHRISAFADFTKKYSEMLGIRNEAFTVTLGLIMSIGLIVSILSLFFNYIGGKRRNTIIKLGQLNVIILLIACTGGMAHYIGIFLTSSIRCYNRMSIFIALNAVIVVCVLIEELFRKISINCIIEYIIIAALMVIGIWDQTSDSFSQYSLFNPEKNEYQWSYKEKEQEYHELNKYFDNIENIVGAGATIYQMPQMAYYGGDNIPFVKMKGYICSKNLKWTYSEWYPAYKEWLNILEQKEPETFLKTIAMMGITGVLIDKESYATEDEFQTVYKGIKNLCNEEGYVDSSGNLYFFDITKYSENYLSKFSQDEMEINRKAIKNEIDGVSITYIGIDKFFTTQNEAEKETYINLIAGETQYGPYIDLPEGEYRITVYGENLANVHAWVTAGGGDKTIKLKNFISSDSKITYDFALEELTEDVEFLMESNEDIRILGYYYELKNTQDYHDIYEYYQGVWNLAKEMNGSNKMSVKGQDLYVGQGKIATINNRMILDANKLQYGPYYYLLEGKYNIKIRGKNLGNAKVWVTSNCGKKEIAVNDLEITDNSISYQIMLGQDEEGIEFLMENQGDSVIEIEEYSYSPVEEEKEWGIIGEYIKEE
ncbi:hypothetical protein IMSAGC002_02628 [Lachnospiraceae bacterium]|nr:hypothetical protein IMSAGC002_02628 [Lachnospiraceae bacterium]